MSRSVKFVPGEGPLQPRVIFVGEAPGEQEDKQGRPFVGKSGKLLNNMLAFMGLRREEVYITNVIKVRPTSNTGNRTPSDEEISSWHQLLVAEIYEVVGNAQNIPIVTLGAVATKALCGMDVKLSKVRGTFMNGIYDVMPTYHPSYLFRNPSAKELVKQDLLKVKELIDGPQD